MNLIKHVFKKHLPSALIILLAFFIGSALLPVNAPTTLVFETPAIEELEGEPAVLVAQVPEDISVNLPLFDVEIKAASSESQKNEVSLLFIIIADVLIIIVVAYVVDIFYRRRKRQ